jgi:hypothetical protein
MCVWRGRGDEKDAESLNARLTCKAHATSAVWPAFQVVWLCFNGGSAEPAAPLGMSAPRPGRVPAAPLGMPGTSFLPLKIPHGSTEAAEPGARHGMNLGETGALSQGGGSRGWEGTQNTPYTRHGGA